MLRSLVGSEMCIRDRYWAQALAAQTDDEELATEFEPLAKALADNEDKIIADFASAQGGAADTGGYYFTDADKTAAVMRPSATLLNIIG